GGRRAAQRAGAAVGRATGAPAPGPWGLARTRRRQSRAIMPGQVGGWGVHGVAQGQPQGGKAGRKKVGKEVSKEVNQEERCQEAGGAQAFGWRSCRAGPDGGAAR